MKVIAGVVSFVGNLVVVKFNIGTLGNMTSIGNNIQKMTFSIVKTYLNPFWKNKTITCFEFVNLTY